MKRLSETIPDMSASSDVSPTVRVLDGALFLAYFLAPDEESSALIQFDGLLDWHYGYPNDEGLDAHPLHGAGLRAYEFHECHVARHGERAWIMTFHDGTLTVYAKTISVVQHSYIGSPAAAINTFLGKGNNRCLDS